VPVLGQIPLDPRVCEAGETGKPAVAKDPSSSTAQALRLMAKHVLPHFNPHRRVAVDELHTGLAS